MKRLAALVVLVLALSLLPVAAGWAEPPDEKPPTTTQKSQSDANYNPNPLGAACAVPGSQDSSACSSNGSDPISGKNGIIRKIANFIALIAGIAAVIMLIIGGFQFVTAAGDPQKAASARMAIIGAVIGLVIVAVAESIVVFALKAVK